MKAICSLTGNACLCGTPGTCRPYSKPTPPHPTEWGRRRIIGNLEPTLDQDREMALYAVEAAAWHVARMIQTEFTNYKGQRRRGHQPELRALLRDLNRHAEQLGGKRTTVV